MKKALILMLVVALAGLLAQPASAAIDTGQEYRIDNLVDAGNNGGPFLMTQVVPDQPSNPISGGEVFWTFCVQRNEYFSPTTNAYEVQKIQTFTELTAPKRYLTGYGAWVYDKFLNAVGTATWNGSTLGSFTKANLGLLQKAMWASMTDGLATVGGFDVGLFTQVGTANSWWTLTSSEKTALDNLGYGLTSFAAAWNPVSGPATWAGQDYIGDIRVLVMVDGNVQDLVGRVTDDSSPNVPEPATLAIWSLLGGLTLAGSQIRRRK
ncbi:MAG: hypothetical protein GXX96_04090 [Planctomycetaceae bacterium]|nr:hypothetical protein [Planctomycetaceae bacterium]